MQHPDDYQTRANELITEAATVLRDAGEKLEDVALNLTMWAYALLVERLEREEARRVLEEVIVPATMQAIDDAHDGRIYSQPKPEGLH